MGIIRDTKPYRILSLDGGGTWALIQAKVLMDIYGPDINGHKILEDFDLVAANSGGGIVAAGLIADMSPAAILDLFCKQQCRESLFKELPFYAQPLARLAGLRPQFSTEGKRHGLSQVLTGITTNALQAIHIPNRKNEDIKFLFTAYDYDRDRAVFFRSFPSPAANFPASASTASVIDAVHASSTAPVHYFDQPAEFGGKRYWDGGIAGLNNPVLAAVLEAIASRVQREEVGVLSIGTGNTFRPVANSTTAINPVLLQPQYDQGVVNDIKKLAQAIVADPPDTDTFIAYMMLGEKLPAGVDECPLAPTSLVRMNPLIRPVVNAQKRWDFPPGSDAGIFGKLAEMDLAVIDQNDVLLINNFCNGWMDGNWLNQPVRHGSDTVNGVPNPKFCEIGHEFYKNAKAAW